MTRYKKTFIFTVAVLLFFVLTNLFIWKGFTENLLTAKNYQGGDLARLGYVHGSKDFRKTFCDLPVRHLESSEYAGQNIDVLTLGDSFSNGGAGGKNCFYQDYIASINNCTVLNLDSFQDIDNISTLSIYLNNGYLDKIKPKYVILESSEKLCIEKLANPIDFDASVSPESLARQKKFDYHPSFPPVSFINEGNFKFLLYSFLYKFSDDAFLSKVYMTELRAPLFSVKNRDKLLFFRDDIRRIPLAKAQAVERLNNNLNTLSDRLRSKGIKLYFMICVDKYNLYRDYLVRKNRYPESTLFEQLRKLPKRYEFIDTKAILAEELIKGEKDVFYADDTHWGWKASRTIFEKIRFSR